MPRRSQRVGSGNATSVLSGYWLWWLIATTVLLVQRPVATPDLWWNLARGRQVVHGELSPSQSLLRLDNMREADWLSGLPFFSIWNMGGLHALAAIPIAAALFVLWMLDRRFRFRRNLLSSVAVLPVLLLLMRDGLQPAPQLLDCLGMLFLWRLVSDSTAAFSFRQSIPVFFLFVAWSNLAPLPIWGLIYLGLIAAKTAFMLDSDASKAPDPQPSSIPGAMPHLSLLVLLSAAFVGGVCNPRGLLAWRDSGVLFASNAFNSADPDRNLSLEHVVYQTSSIVPDVPLLMLWSVCLVCGIVVLRRHQGDHQGLTSTLWQWYRTIWHFTVFAIPVLVSLLNRDNLPLCVLWVLLHLTDSNSKQFGGMESAPGSSVSQASPKSAFALSLVMLVLAGVEATGHGLSPHSRPGWGISQELDVRLLTLNTTAESADKLVVWAPDRRSAGVAAWLNESLALVDHPQRALLGGRTVLHHAIVHDLLGAHRARYRREDGGWGGWFHQLKEWDVQLLFVPVEMLPLSKSLHKSTWKIMDLDSPTAPLGTTDGTRFSIPILESLQQQGFVESGPWQPTADMYRGFEWRLDFIEAAGLGPDPLPAIRQSLLFRAMDLPLASLRALLPIRQQARHRLLTAELRNCQRDLCHQEWSNFGKACYLRRLILNTLSKAETETEAFRESQPWALILSDEELTCRSEWIRCVELYCAGRMQEAIAVLQTETAEQRFAQAMLWLENGESARAATAFDGLTNQHIDPALKLAAQYWNQQIEAFNRP